MQRRRDMSTMIKSRESIKRRIQMRRVEKNKMDTMEGENLEREEVLRWQKRVRVVMKQ